MIRRLRNISYDMKKCGIHTENQKSGKNTKKVCKMEWNFISFINTKKINIDVKGTKFSETTFIK